MSTYKIIDSTLSILYCAKCANEDLEVIEPGRLLCRDCGMDVKFDPNLIRVGQLKGTKYKMRDSKRYSFREMTDEARQDAFKDKYVPSPDPGKGRIGWRGEEEPQAAQQAAQHAQEVHDEVEIRIAGVDEHPGKGWRNQDVVDIITDMAADEEDGHDAGSNGVVCDV
ncbi:MAG: hypothetical protein KJ069_29340 [Anaerolineae bacterium]|nr:hypothetical protein [Anaerolineae bacterium]